MELATIVLALVGVQVAGNAVNDAPAPGVLDPSRVVEIGPGLPPSGDAAWIENAGQWPEFVLFAGAVPGGIVRLERDGLAFQRVDPENASQGLLVKWSFAEQGAACSVQGEEPQATSFNFFVGKDSEAWVRDALGYTTVRYRDLLPGIDFLVKRTERGVKYDLHVAPGAGLERFVLVGQGGVQLDAAASGQVELETTLSTLLQLPGRAWEVLPDGTTRDVVLKVRAVAATSFGFEAPAWDRSLSLVIDPELVWSSFLGTPGDDAARPVEYDHQGNLYVSGGVNGLGFPQTPGTFQMPNDIPSNIFVVKLRATDHALVYSSLFGGSGGEFLGGITVDHRRMVTVVGSTRSGDFPVTTGAFDTTRDSLSIVRSAFVLQLAQAGNDLVYSTFLEGEQLGSDIWSVRIDSQGRAVLGGFTSDPTFPTTPDALFPQHVGGNDGIVARLSPKGDVLEYSTFLGGTGSEGISDIDLGPDGEIIVGGPTASDDYPTTQGAVFENNPAHIAIFVSCLSPTGNQLIWSTYFGGDASNEDDSLFDLAVDSLGTVFITGETNSVSFPTTPGAVQPVSPGGFVGYLTRLAPDGSQAIYSTYLAGEFGGGGHAVSVDASGVATVAGLCGQGFPVTPGAFDTEFGADRDAIVARVSPAGDRYFYASYVGGDGHERFDGGATTPTGRAAMAGICFFPFDFPTTPDSLQPLSNGGQFEGVATVMELVLDGVELGAPSTPSCLGPIQLNATRMPVAGAFDFGIYGSVGPPSTPGCLLIGTATARPTFVQGAAVWIDPDQALAIVPIQTRPDGTFEHPLPLPPDSAGTKLAFQALFEPSSDPTCPGGWSASNVVTIFVP